MRRQLPAERPADPVNPAPGAGAANTAPAWSWRESRAGAIALLVLLVALTALQGWQLAQTNARLREDTLTHARLRAAQVTSAVAELTSLLLHDVDATLGELVSVYQRRPDDDFAEIARQATAQLPREAVLQVALVAPDGFVRQSTLPMNGRVYVGDREYFQVHLAAGPDRLFISRPLLGRISGQWAIQFSRPIRAHGELLGVMVLSMAPTYLHNAMARVTLESEDTLAVLHPSGEYMARSQDEALSLGRKFDLSQAFAQAHTTGAGVFTGRSPIDGVERIFRWQRLDDYPVLVLIGLSRSAVLGPVERTITEANTRAWAVIGLLWATAVVVFLLVQRVRAQIRRREEAEYLAMHDALTGLHSRLALMAHLDQVLAQAQVLGGQVGVLYLDLDGFKPVNDRHGHACGDEVLKAVAGRLRRCVRGGDFAARIGGDEFVVVVAPLADAQALDRLSGRITEALATPIRIGELALDIGASIGLARFPEQGRDADALLGQADRAMYARKRTRAQR